MSGYGEWCMALWPQLKSISSFLLMKCTLSGLPTLPCVHIITCRISLVEAERTDGDISVTKMVTHGFIIVRFFTLSVLSVSRSLMFVWWLAFFSSYTLWRSVSDHVCLLEVWSRSWCILSVLIFLSHSLTGTTVSNTDKFINYIDLCTFLVPLTVHMEFNSTHSCAMCLS